MKKVIVLVVLLISNYSYADSSGKDKSGDKGIGRENKQLVGKKRGNIKFQDDVTYLDMSKSDEPESEFPIVTKKGSL